MSIDYSQKDFTSTYEDLLSIVEASTTKWSPRTSTEADPGVVILKLMALLEDKHAYRFDMAQAQAYLDTVSNKDYAEDLLRMLGYIMKEARAASGKVTISKVRSAWNSDSDLEEVEIPMFSVVTNTSKTIKFFTTEPTIILQGSEQSVRIPVMAGEPFQITKEGVSEFTLKDIDEDGRLLLSKTALAQNGVFIRTLDADGTEIDEWSLLDLVIVRPQGTKYFTVSTLESGENYIQFPSDFENLIGSSKIKVYATYTDGAASNVVKGTLSLFEDSDLKALFEVSQAESFYNGQDSESIDAAVNHYYEQKDVCNTLVTSSDYAAAIRYLLDENNNRKFSVALVDSAIDRAYKINSTYDHKQFICMKEKDSLYNRIDVVPLSASPDYVSSFKLATEANLSNFIESQLSEVRSAAVSINTAISPRILAVTVPSMTIRISNYSDSAAIMVKDKIINYFYSTYKSDLLQPGQPLDYSRIVKDIKSLSSNIQSVSMEDISYNAYSKLASVDGVTSQPAGSDSDIQEDVLVRSALSGALPLFKFSNRQNTKTKSTLAYSALLASSDAVEENDLDIAIPIPWGVDTSILSTQAISPTITNLVVSDTYSQQSSLQAEGYRRIPLSRNHLLQTRRPLRTSSADYGYGLQYAFYSTPKWNQPVIVQSPVSVNYVSTVKAGSVFAQHTVIRPESPLQLSEGVSFAVSSDGTNYEAPQLVSTLQAEMYYNLQATSMSIAGDIVLLSESVVSAGSSIARGSKINQKVYVSTAAIDGKEYQLLEGEKLYLFDSAGAQKAVINPGSWILTQGLSIPVSGPITDSPLPKVDQILTSTQTISLLRDDLSTISTDFVYFLSLNSSSPSLTLTSTGYMLEEDEILVYATPSVSEYIILGPGTVISGQGQLVNTPFMTIEQIDASLFRPVESTITAQAYELSTYRSPKYIVHNINDTSDTRFPIDWTGLSDKILKIYEVSEETQEDQLIADLSNSDAYQVRLIAQIQTDANGVAVIDYPVSFTLHTDGAPDIPVTTNTSSNETQITSSVPFSVLATQQSKPLLNSGISAFLQVNQLITPQPPVDIEQLLSAFEYKIRINSDSITTAQTISTSLYVPESTRLLLCNFSVSGKFTRRISTRLTIHIESGGTNYPVRIFSTGQEITNSYLDFDSFIAHGVTLLLPIDQLRGVAGAVNLVVSFPRSYLEDLAGAEFIFDKLSYVTGYSKEMLNSSSFVADNFLQDLSTPDSLVTKIAAIDTDARFDWLAYPSELLEHPTNSNSYFNPAHPMNKHTLPFINVVPQKIRVVKN